MKFVNELVVYEASVLHLTCPSMVINYSSTEYPPIPEVCIFGLNLCSRFSISDQIWLFIFDELQSPS